MWYQSLIASKVNPVRKQEFGSIIVSADNSLESFLSAILNGCEVHQSIGSSPTINKNILAKCTQMIKLSEKARRTIHRLRHQAKVEVNQNNKN